MKMPSAIINELMTSLTRLEIIIEVRLVLSNIAEIQIRNLRI